MKNTKKLPDEFLNLVSGGTLPEGWEEIADQMAPAYLAQYPNITFEEASAMLKQYVTDPDDFAAIQNYMKKYF